MEIKKASARAYEAAEFNRALDEIRWRQGFRAGTARSYPECLLFASGNVTAVRVIEARVMQTQIIGDDFVAAEPGAHRL